MKKAKKFFVCMVLGLLLLSNSCNINQTSSMGEFPKGDTYKIAILGAQGYVYADMGFMNGLKMAIQELADQVKITWEHYDDSGEYDQGLLIGTQLANDNSILAVLTFQDFDVIDTLAPIYEEAGKPLISVQGCYDSTLDENNSYFFSDFLSAEDQGKAMCDYAKAMEKQNVVCSHTKTEFELEEMKGFQQRAKENDLNIVDMAVGPFNKSELKSMYNNWKILDVDAIYLAYYTHQRTGWLSELVKYLRETDRQMLIMGDFSLNTDENLKQYGKYMENVVITAPYPVVSSAKSQAFTKKYEDSSGYSVSYVAFQSYDLIHLIGEILKSGVDSYDEFVSQMKNEQGYEGVSGKIQFDAEGKLTGMEPQYLKVKNGRFEIIPTQ